MDETDWAQAMETRERDACIKALTERRHPQGTGTCIDCLEAVEPERVKALRCSSCQQDEDKRQRVRYGQSLTAGMPRCSNR